MFVNFLKTMYSLFLVQAVFAGLIVIFPIHMMFDGLFDTGPEFFFAAAMTGSLIEGFIFVYLMIYIAPNYLSVFL